MQFYIESVGLWQNLGSGISYLIIQWYMLFNIYYDVMKNTKNNIGNSVFYSSSNLDLYNQLAVNKENYTMS